MKYEVASARHAPEIARALRSNKFEIGDQGLLVPSAKIFVSGLYSVRTRTRDGATPWEDHPNLLPTEGIKWMLDNLIAATGVAAYISLYASAISPAANWTAASYPATASEITSGSEGYSEGARQLWNAAAAADPGTKDNYSTPSVFTIVTASTLSVNGVGLHTVSTKGATTGKLISSTRFGSTRSFSNTDEFDVKYRLTITSS
jgi:hypothetical protein